MTKGSPLHGNEVKMLGHARFGVVAACTKNMSTELCRRSKAPEKE